MGYRRLVVVCLGMAVAAAACGGDIRKRDGGSSQGGSGGRGGTPGLGGSGGTGGGSGGTGGGMGGSGGAGGAGGTAGRDAGPDRPPVDASTTDAGAMGPSAQFVMLYNDILRPNCSPCHVTNTPRSGMFDLGDVMTAFTTLNTGATACATAMPKDFVVNTRADDSYLIKKLVGAADICGVRMPRGCTVMTDGGTPPTPDAMPMPAPDAAAPDAGAAADTSPPVDAADTDAAAIDAAAVDAAAVDAAAIDVAAVDVAGPAPDVTRDTTTDAAPPPRACLTPAMIDTLKAWINGLPKLKALMAHDPAYGNTWSIQTNLQVGAMTGSRPWVDYPNTYLVSVDMAAMNLIGKPWVKVHAQSKAYNGGPQATLTLTAPADVYLVVDDRWGMNPVWLAGWTDTGANFTVFENATRPMLPFSIYKKSMATAGTVTTPPIGANTAFDYFIVID
jgi:hypothetical protein